jgi:hypothetical protein
MQAKSFRGSFAAGGLFALLLAAPLAQGTPSTFGPVIGSAILCRGHLDNAYFYSYLLAAFGPSYKHEGGAYWFKAEGELWGAQLAEVMVSDDTSELVFIGAITEAAPDELEASIRKSVGIGHVARDASRYPVRMSYPGSKIVYFNNKSKIFCAQHKQIPTGSLVR